MLQSSVLLLENPPHPHWLIDRTWQPGGGGEVGEVGGHGSCQRLWGLLAASLQYMPILALIERNVLVWHLRASKRGIF